MQHRSNTLSIAVTSSRSKEDFTMCDNAFREVYSFDAMTKPFIEQGVCSLCTGADPEFPIGGGTNPLGGGRQHTISPNFQKNCMKLRNFWVVRAGGAPLRLSSHLRFFRRELLHELFSPCNRKKWVHNPLLNFSVHTIVDQIAGVNAPI